MALHLNFYHEIQKDAKVRARDPIKLAGFALAGVAVLLIGYYFHRASEVEKVLETYRSQQEEWRKLQPLMKETTARQKELQKQQEKNARLVSRLKGRFYWAPLLQAVAQASPAEVQITSLEGKFERQEISILLQGLAAGSNPRQAAEQYRSALEGHLESIYGAAQVTFDGNSLETLQQTVVLDGKTLPLARFGMRITFKQKGEPAPDSPEASQETSSTSSTISKTP